jgi:hypothetical protein
MTLATFRDELSFVFDNRSDTGFSTARLNRWVNQAYLHCTHPTVHRHRELQATYTATLVTGTNEYSISAATVGFQITTIRNVFHIQAAAATPTARRRKLHPKSHLWFDERTIGSGQPTVYAVDGTTLMISAVPTATENNQLVRLRVWREPALLALDADVTVLPTYWDRVLLLGAQWLAELDLGYRDRAELTKGDYMALINEPKDRMELEAQDTGWEVELAGFESRTL